MKRNSTQNKTWGEKNILRLTKLASVTYVEVPGSLEIHMFSHWGTQQFRAFMKVSLLF